MKHFTDADVVEHGRIAKAGRLTLDRYPEDLCARPLPWQRRGLQQTASGYGAKLTSQYKLSFNGKLYRIYHSCYGNASSAWFVAKGRKIFVH